MKLHQTTSQGKPVELTATWKKVSPSLFLLELSYHGKTPEDNLLVYPDQLHPGSQEAPENQALECKGNLMGISFGEHHGRVVNCSHIWLEPETNEEKALFNNQQQPLICDSDAPNTYQFYYHNGKQSELDQTIIQSTNDLQAQLTIEELIPTKATAPRGSFYKLDDTITVLSIGCGEKYCMFSIDKENTLKIINKDCDDIKEPATHQLKIPVETFGSVLAWEAGPYHCTIYCHKPAPTEA